MSLALTSQMIDHEKGSRIRQSWKFLRFLLESESKSVAEWLTVVATVLIALVFLRLAGLTKGTMAVYKDAVDVLSKIATVLALAIGAGLSYIRFFKGRLLSPKLLILPTSGLIPGPWVNLHWIEVEVKNTGTVSIWNYVVQIKATFHGEDSSTREVTNFLQWDESSGETAVDVGESAYEHALLSVPTDGVNAVTFQIAVYGNQGVLWTRCLTKPNH